MCNPSGIDFGRRNLLREEIEGKSVIEVGAMDVNGTFRGIVSPLNPAKYVGIDIEEGPGVDMVCDATELIAKFGENSFDVVISTEMLEHVNDWRDVVSNFKGILKPGGVMLVTTRSKGFPHHAYPYDFWRFEIDDMKQIFSDMSVDVIEADVPEEPGVFVKVRKNQNFTENDLSQIKLYSMITMRRTRDLNVINTNIAKSKMFITSFFGRARNSIRYRSGV